MESLREALMKWSIAPYYYQVENMLNSKNPNFNYFENFCTQCFLQDEQLAADEELLCEEQRLITQSSFKQENQVTVAFAAQGKGKGRDMTKMQCYSCKEYGHIAINCGRKFCNYCKQQGHIIKECPTRPQNRRVNAFQAGINGFPSDNLSSAGLTNQVAAPVVSPSPSTTSGQILTPEMVQQMIVSAFSALGLQGENLAWEHRIKVAAQLSSLFAWLHSKRISFGCVKSSTIAIFQDFNIKVFDFGFLARASEEDDSVDVRNYRLCSNAPEILDGIRTLKSDVYTFGLLLLELIADEAYISRLDSWLQDEFQGDLRPILHNSLPQNDEEVGRFNSLVVKCLKRDPKERPDMKHVCATLCNLREGSNSEAAAAALFEKLDLSKKDDSNLKEVCVDSTEQNCSAKITALGEQKEVLESSVTDVGAENATLKELQSIKVRLLSERSTHAKLEASVLEQMLNYIKSIEEEVQALLREKSLKDVRAENATLKELRSIKVRLLSERSTHAKLEASVLGQMLKYIKSIEEEVQAQASVLGQMLNYIKSIEEEFQALLREKSVLEHDTGSAASAQQHG